LYLIFIIFKHFYCTFAIHNIDIFSGLDADNISLTLTYVCLDWRRSLVKPEVVRRLNDVSWFPLQRRATVYRDNVFWKTSPMRTVSCAAQLQQENAQSDIDWFHSRAPRLDNKPSRFPSRDCQVPVASRTEKRNSYDSAIGPSHELKRLIVFFICVV